MKSTSRKLKIAIIAPPWLSLYPGCFYGIENVVHHLATNLTKKGHQVELFTVSGSSSNVSRVRWYHKDDQYQHIHRPWYEVVTISVSHILYALNAIREAGDFDIIHDHNSFMGPAIMAYANDNLPPILHTLHEPFTDKRTLEKGIPDNRLMYEQFKYLKHLSFNGVSNAQLRTAPKELKPYMKGVIYNGVDPQEYFYSSKKSDYFLSVARISENKGQATAARAAYELGEKLYIAGTVGSKISSPEVLKRELANPKSLFLNDPDFCYFKERVSPYLVPGRIEYIGTITGEEKLKYFAKAKGFVFPIDWEEPFGMAVIDALASGTPVVAFNKGAMPEIIEHGVTGFIAEDYDEFKAYMRRVSELKPRNCRKSVKERFSTDALSENYLKLYNEIIIDYRRRKNSSRLLIETPSRRLASPKLLKAGTLQPLRRAGLSSKL